MSKIGDLFVHIGAKTEGLQKGLTYAKNSVKGFGQSMKGIMTSASALWAAVGVAAIAAADKFAHTSQRFGDAWDNTTARMKGAWNTFLSSLTSWDWDNFGQRIRNAMSGAGESQKMQDLEAEVRRSIELKQDQQRAELNADLVAMRNQKLSYAERQKAAEDYLARMKNIYDQESKYRTEAAATYTAEYLTNAGLKNTAANVEALKRFVADIAPNPEMLDKYAKGYANNKSPLYAIANYYQSTGDATIEKVTKGWHAAAVAANAYTEENQRVITMMNSFSVKAQQTTEDTEETAEAVIDLTHANKVLRDGLEELANITDMKQGNTGLMGSLTGVGTISDEEIEKRIEFFEKMQAASEELAYSLQDGLISALDELANALAGVDGSSFGTVMKAFLTPLADAAVKAGMIILASGEAVEAFKKSLMSLNGGAAIAAGLGLIAVGTVAKIGLASIGRSGSSAGTASASSASGASSSDVNTKYEDVNINVTIDGKLKGSDIVLAAKNTSYSWAR